MTDRKKRLARLWPILGTLLLVIVIFLLAHANEHWFAALNKPAFYPGPLGIQIAVFGLPLLALCTNECCIVHMQKCSRKDEGTRLLFLAAGTLTGLWAFLVFVMQAVGLSVFALVALCAVLTLLTRRVARLYRWPALLLVPVWAGSLCALVLNYTLAMIN